MNHAQCNNFKLENDQKPHKRKPWVITECLKPIFYKT